jgi:hypothetical protein
MGKIIFDVLVGLAVIAGTVFGAMTLFYTAALYYGWKPEEGALIHMLPASWALLSLAIFGIVVLLSTWALISVRMGWLWRRPSQQFVFVNEPPRNIVAGREFINQRVPLDGMAYRDCTFTNVTFLYSGTAPVEISGSHYKGVFLQATILP